MKTASIILLLSLCFSSFAQTKKPVGRVKQSRVNGNKSASINQAGNQNPVSTSSDSLKPRQTATDKYLNGPERKGVPAGATSAAASPFAAGVHPADNAARTFDTVAATRNNNAGSPASNNPVTNTTIRGGNDTIFNINTIGSKGGVTTNSGAVDRSGQTQFGQTNWGTSRSTVGESQWTVPPPITASFNKEFSGSTNATWTRNNADTSIYSAKYRTGAQWVITNYNASGQRLDMRTEFPLLQPPAPVSVYMAKQPVGFRAATIYKLQVQGRPDLYEIETAAGKKIYINSDGMEVNY